MQPMHPWPRASNLRKAESAQTHRCPIAAQLLCAASARRRVGAHAQFGLSGFTRTRNMSHEACRFNTQQGACRYGDESISAIRSHYRRCLLPPLSDAEVGLSALLCFAQCNVEQIVCARVHIGACTC
jgi:hypothetical protein